MIPLYWLLCTLVLSTLHPDPLMGWRQYLREGKQREHLATPAAGRRGSTPFPEWHFHLAFTLRFFSSLPSLARPRWVGGERKSWHFSGWPVATLHLPTAWGLGWIRKVPVFFFFLYWCRNCFLPKTQFLQLCEVRIFFYTAELTQNWRRMLMFNFYYPIFKRWVFFFFVNLFVNGPKK